MNNIFFTLCCLVFISSVGRSQVFNVNKLIVDKETKFPLENVSVSNDIDNSSTNHEGFFIFNSSKNEINFNLLGYNSIKSTFDAIAKKDTVFMESKAFILDEVLVSNVEPFMKKVYDKMSDNFIKEYTVNFFLRSILKNEDSIIVLQDIQGKRGRYDNSKYPYDIEVLNMRKTSLFEKKNAIDFTLPDFNQFFSPPIPIREKTNFTEVIYNDADFRKIVFEGKEKNAWGQTLKGYFIINKNDYAIVEHYISLYDNPDLIPYVKFTLSSMRYKTTNYERFFSYSKNEILNKYYLKSSKLNTQLEVLRNKKDTKPAYVDFAMDYFITNAVTRDKVESNFSVDKDIFKAKFPYSADFWNNQNQLPLTTELKVFLKKVSQNKDKKKEFEIIGNF
ncbi:hypothetical protein HNP99_003275 [Flavobacterium sp. 28A]|uniref:hypothetical protein n=1 Tax=Flavobacterium sp. 28A TaxID=2735895 RepID=UPI001570B6AC|nr:hypothetical protein [Flavobacterium sp. 28A]NRT16901.1 hypothetical protein [Flavobacterium sp. 28A]